MTQKCDTKIFRKDNSEAYEPTKNSRTIFETLAILNKTGQQLSFAL